MTARTKTASLAPVAASVAPGAVVRSSFKVDAPAEVYQTNVIGKVQDSSSLLQLVIALAPQMADALSATLAAHRGAAPLMTKLMDVNDDAARQSPVLSKVIVPTLRRFDGREIEVYNPVTDAMEGLHLRPEGVIFSLDGTELTVMIHRKYLPPSTQHGNAPMRFAFLIQPEGVERELLISSRFTLGSKQGASSGERPEPKRVRPDASTKPLPAPAGPVDELITEMFTSSLAPVPATQVSGGKRKVRPADVLPVETSAAPVMVAQGAPEPKRARFTTMNEAELLKLFPPMPLPLGRGDSIMSLSMVPFARATSMGLDTQFLLPGASPVAAATPSLTPSLIAHFGNTAASALAKTVDESVFSLEQTAVQVPVVSAPMGSMETTRTSTYSPLSSQRMLTALGSLASMRAASECSSQQSSPCNSVSSADAEEGNASPVGSHSGASELSASPEPAFFARGFFDNILA